MDVALGPSPFTTGELFHHRHDRVGALCCSGAQHQAAVWDSIPSRGDALAEGEGGAREIRYWNLWMLEELDDGAESPFLTSGTDNRIGCIH